VVVREAAVLDADDRDRGQAREPRQDRVGPAGGVVARQSGALDVLVAIVGDQRRSLAAQHVRIAGPDLVQADDERPRGVELVARAPQPGARAAHARLLAAGGDGDHLGAL
jgi:hypothetical protein